jgi:hypothetical protein
MLEEIKKLCENCDGEYVYDWLGHKRSTCRKCWQENKENTFDAIKKHRESVKDIYGEINAVMYPLKWIDYLIEQAESRQRCNEAFTYMSKTCDYWYEKAKQLEKKFDRLKQLGDPRYWGCVELDTFDEIMEASKDGKGEEDRG